MDRSDIIVYERLYRFAHLVRIEYAHLPKSCFEGTYSCSESYSGFDPFRHEHKTSQMVLNAGDLFPFAFLCRLPLLAIPIWVDIGKSWDRSICTTEKGAVHYDLMP